MKNDLYVDNILSSFSSQDEIITFYKESRSLMSKAGFNLRSWASNSKLLNDLADSESVLDKDQKTKVSGLRWNKDTDKLCFAYSKIDPTLKHITKREILSQSSSIYDPLGIFGPVTVRSKILIQDLWKRKVEWDEPFQEDILSKWSNLAADLQKSVTLELDRFYFNSCQSGVNKYDLNVFVDASLSAYGAVAYITNETKSSIVMAKNRVSPVKQLTLPQLELMAALIGARLANHITETLQPKNTTFWSDSQIVILWLNKERQLKRFVKNRIDEIKCLSKAKQWRYCPTSDNPVDLQTRGISAEKFVNNRLWLSGPEWLTQKDRWPVWNQLDSTSTLLCNEDGDDETENISNAPLIIENVMNIERYSSLRKLTRITAYVVRFINNCKLLKDKRNTSELSCQELNYTFQLWIHSCQHKTYEEDIAIMNGQSDKRSALMKQLRLFLDSDGFIRCGGRIHNAQLSETARFPYLIPHNHQLTKLIVLDAHERLKHAGVLNIVTNLRQTYGIPCIRQCVRKVVSRCLICRKHEGKSYKAPDPAPLPKIRVTEAPPFTVTGVDFTGALYVKEKPTNITQKVYVCLFTCAITRSVHLEIVKDLTEESFLLAFRRFTAGKSLPRTMISDNGSSYLAASGTIERLTKSPTIVNQLAKDGTSWQFIPKRAPWYGGFWERLIGVTKSSLQKTLGRSCLSLEMLQTVITEIEAVINDRP